MTSLPLFFVRQIKNIKKLPSIKSYILCQITLRILLWVRDAFDAAIAVSAALAVVYPHMTGLGGDSFWLTYSHSEREVRAFNGSGRSGSQVTRELYAGEERIPNRGVRSAITVPGMVDGNRFFRFEPD